MVVLQVEDDALHILANQQLLLQVCAQTPPRTRCRVGKLRMLLMIAVFCPGAPVDPQELAQAANTLDESKMEVELGEMSVKQAEESMRLSGKNYRSGLATLSDYLESQVQWQKAYESCVNSHFRLYLSSVDYLRCSGLLVP